MDAIIILGALIGLDGYPGRVARFRVQHALPLIIKDYPESWVVISGGTTTGRPVSEAQAMGEWAVDRAREGWGEAAARNLAARLIPEEKSRNTADSAYYTALLMQERNLQIAGLVTDSLHMPRAEYLFRRTFPPRQLVVRPLPAPGLWQDYWSRRRYLRLSKFLLWEVGAWLKICKRGVWR